ncbi:putative glycoside hydrolase [Phytophthora cinnamomi]|uniref:putative glycoside hydrolase n=1 Tax=Phytophthora cinnamomi TaxID=4785 RepID=UPI0035595E68|nr:putative glycoside hydrolase [Phytophthora cinnamomi]
MTKLTMVAAISAMAVAFGGATANQIDVVEQNTSSSRSGSAEGDTGVVASGCQIADVSGAQVCGGVGFDYLRYWVGPLPDGDNTKLSCVSGYRCQPRGPSELFWCKQYALPLNAKCGGYTFYTLFKCVDGTACKIDPIRLEPRCLPLE